MNTENVPFIIVGNNLITYGALNYEDVNSYNIKVTTTDNDGLPFSKDFTININNLAEPPTDFTLDITTVDEDVLIGYEIGTFSVSNPNAGSIYSFTIDSSGVGVPFSIDDDKLTTSGILDYETQNRYIFDVIATDGQYSITRNFSIDINNKPDAPHDIQLDNADIFENAVNGDIVGTFTTADQDSSVHTYELLTTDGPFYIDVSDNVLKTSGGLDYETDASYNITVRSTDDDGLFLDKTFTINVKNINEVPTDIQISKNTVNETVEIGHTVCTFTTTDPDAGDTFTYTLNTEDVPFDISGNQLVTSGPLDYETDTSYNINVTTSDSGDLTFSKDFKIYITNVNEPPTNLTLDITNVDENVEIGYKVGTFTVEDPDDSSINTFTYTISGESIPFTIDTNGDMTTTGLIDFEAQSSYSFHVIVNDGANDFDGGVFTINVNNKDDPPTLITLSPSVVSEGAAEGTTVGTFTTADQDTDASRHTYELVLSDLNGPFYIEDNQLKTYGGAENQNIRTTDSSYKPTLHQNPAEARLNYDEKSYYDILVRVTEPRSCY